jgi:hypothetical protein
LINGFFDTDYDAFSEEAEDVDLTIHPNSAVVKKVMKWRGVVWCGKVGIP